MFTVLLSTDVMMHVLESVENGQGRIGVIEGETENKEYDTLRPGLPF